MVIIIADGVPASRLPLFFVSQRYAQRPGNSMNRTYPIPAKRTQSAVRPLEALMSATVSARRTQPTTLRRVPLKLRPRQTGEERRTIIADAGGQDHDTDRCVQELQLDEDAAQNREGSDANRDGDEENEESKTRAVVGESVVDRHSKSSSEAERDEQTRDRYQSGRLGVTANDARVYLHSDEEKEEDESDICSEVEYRHRVGGEDCRGEVGNMAHDGRSEDNSSNDFCNDTRLANASEDEREDLGHADDDY